MKKYYYPEAVRNADRIAVEKLKYDSFFLMESAGRNAGSVILTRYPDLNNFCILCGPGNNAGDGFILADFLLRHNKNVFIITSVKEDQYKNDALKAVAELKSNPDIDKCRIIYFNDTECERIASALKTCDMVIDALLGTGASGAPRGNVKNMLQLISRVNGKIKVALDMPTGINIFNGSLYEEYFKADITISFLAVKSGMSFYPASEVCGEIITVSIGVPLEAVLSEATEDSISLYTRDDIEDLLPVFDKNIHKGTRGSVLIYGGSFRYRGAPLLSALGALRSGCGVVYLAIPDFMVPAASVFIPEAVFIPLKTENNVVCAESIRGELSDVLTHVTSVVFGPGVGRDEIVPEILKWIYETYKGPMVIDADALYFMSGENFKLRNNTVVTPHAGEAGRLLGKTAPDITSDRLGAVNKLSELYGVALLKGKDTLIKSGKVLRVIGGGSPVLAVPGSGDVLSGIIGAFSGIKDNFFDAVTLAALLHATAGSELAVSKGVNGTLAREIADEIRNLIR